MGFNDFIKTSEKLEKLAEMMYDEIKNSKEDTVSRYISTVTQSTSFVGGREAKGISFQTDINKEMMDSGIYNCTSMDDTLFDNFKEATVARDLQERRFVFKRKGIPLPDNEINAIETIPSSTDIYDKELKEFSKRHSDTRIGSQLTVEHRIIINSRGGKFIQRVPHFCIFYSQGYMPVQTSRHIDVVCNTDEDIRRFQSLIKFIADPTPDHRIKRSSSFSEAFQKLYEISKLKYGSLADAGITEKGLYDVVMLTGVPVHEIFGHHFEEPIRLLSFGESGTFKHDQIITDKNIILKDNPRQEIEGYRVLGFTHFDAYGRARPARTNIKDGKICEFLGGEYADSEKLKQYLNLEKSDFVGNSAQYDDGYFPQVRMSCTVLEGKSEDINLEGMIVLVSHNGHTNPHDKTYLVEGSEAYVIKNGEPRRVIPLQVTGGINQALANMTVIDDLSYQTGLCGKPDPIDPHTGNGRSPTSQFAKSQVWKGQQVYPMPVSDKHLKILVE